MALAWLRREPLAVRIVRIPHMAGADVEGIAEHPAAAGQMLLHVGAQTVGTQARQRRGHRDGRVRAWLPSRRTRGDRDDPACGATTIDRVTAAQHFNALDQGRVKICVAITVTPG